MAIRHPDNLYRGVNAHLNSYLQQANQWSTFHADHITHLREAIQVILPGGYFVLSERSLQLVRDDPHGSPLRQRSIADVAVFRSGTTPPQDDPVNDFQPVMEVPLLATLDEPEDVAGLVIVRPADNDEMQIVTRVELLSPANKPPGSHYRQYLAKRADMLLAGINLIEIDYLHMRHSPLSIVPDYTQGAAKARPFVILVSNTQPNLDEGRTQIYGAFVDEPLPALPLPLFDDEQVRFELDEVYQQTYRANAAYGQLFVDYSVDPVQIDSYISDDQLRIRSVMDRAT